MASRKKESRAPRRLATLLAVAGTLMVSSGIAVLAANPANAAPPGGNSVKVNVCHATNSDANPYTFVTVDDDSKKLQAHLAHRDSPNKIWHSDGTFGTTSHSAGDPKPDLIQSYTDSSGVFHDLDGDITSASCNPTTPDDVMTTATVDFTDATCETPEGADWQGVGDHATFAVTSGSAAPGQSIVVTATADDGYYFLDAGENPVVTLDFEHTYPALEGCTEVLPPVVPTAPTFVDATCTVDPSVVLPTVAGVDYQLTGTPAAGESIAVDAVASGDNPIADGATTHWEFTFDTPAGCDPVTVVDPPVVDPPVVVTPTVVDAGLAGAPTDLSNQGLALIMAGLLLLFGAGVIALARTDGGTTRS